MDQAARFLALLPQKSKKQIINSNNANNSKPVPIYFRFTIILKKIKTCTKSPNNPNLEKYPTNPQSS